MPPTGEFAKPPSMDSSLDLGGLALRMRMCNILFWCCVIGHITDDVMHDDVISDVTDDIIIDITDDVINQVKQIENKRYPEKGKTWKKSFWQTIAGCTLKRNSCKL